MAGLEAGDSNLSDFDSVPACCGDRCKISRSSRIAQVVSDEAIADDLIDEDE